MLGPVFDAARGGRPAQNRFTALRQFEIWTCNASVADCSQDDSYQRALRERRPTPSPADAPRPVAPMLLLRDFTFSPVRATHVRIVVRDEPVHRRAGLPGRAGRRPVQRDGLQQRPARTATRFVRVAELQAFGRSSRVQ